MVSSWFMPAPGQDVSWVWWLFVRSVTRGNFVVGWLAGFCYCEIPCTSCQSVQACSLQAMVWNQWLWRRHQRNLLTPGMNAGSLREMVCGRGRRQEKLCMRGLRSWGMLCDGVGGERSLEDVSGVFSGQAEAVCLWSQHNGKVAGGGVPLGFQRATATEREMGPC